jgi:hypothetical protein
MMAHASRDPFWKAKVRSETAITPAAAAVIEDKCLRCHAPAQHYGYRLRNSKMAFADLKSEGSEGVTCTVCHQIAKDNLGARESFNGGFRIGEEKRIYGPHADPFQMPMLHHTAYTATESKHVLDSALCGTCHTVITPTLDAKGRVLGEFIEQAPYLEWLASDFASSGATCQSCHVPVLDDGKGQPVARHIAHNPMGRPFPPTRPRTPFGLHSFSGANVGMLDLLAGTIPDESAILRRNAVRTRASLESALDLELTPRVDGDTLEVAVDVRNRTGHKLPTAFPSRRVWLEFRILDAAGATLFVSGDWDRATGELRAAADQPHRSVIESAGQVIVYEAGYLDSTGRPTHSLLRAASYRKDNRILPHGFDASRRLPGGLTARQIAPVGTSADAGFVPGEHRVRYRYRWQPGRKPARVSVTAWYQSIAPAHVAALQGNSAEINQFRNAYPSARAPVAMANRDVPLSRFADK